MSTALIAAFTLFGLAAAQALIIGRWRDALARRHARAPLPDSDCPMIAVVVPARDEEEHIAAVLQDLHAQRYPRERMAVIVVDDGSSDRTVAIAEGMRRNWPQLSVLRNAGAGKKSAITTAIQSTDARFIVLTDADARFGRERVRVLVEQAVASRADLLIAPVWTEGPGALGRLQEEEQAALLGMALGSALEGAPALAYGANLLVAREAFLAVGGYAGDRFASGDDVFLLRRMRHAGRSIAVAAEPDAAVTVRARTSIGAFLGQRLRWAGKMRGAIGGVSLLGLAALLWPWALLGFTLRFQWVASMGQHAFYQALLLATAWCLWLLPVVGLVREARRLMQRPGSAWGTAIAYACFTLYAPIIAVLALVVRPKWKGRRV